MSESRLDFTFVVMESLQCVPFSDSVEVGRFHRLALNFARRSSSDTACRKVRTMVFDVVNGNLFGMMPTESTVSLSKEKMKRQTRLDYPAEP